MAKLNGATKWISITMAFVVLFTGVIASYTLLQAKTASMGDAVTKLEKDGCKPSQAHTTQIAVIETRLEGIEKQQGAILKQGDVILAEIKKRP